MKSILKTLRPEPVANIINRKQTVIVCNNFPKDYVGWVYLYCTKKEIKGEMTLAEWLIQNRNRGKVVARFWCDKVEFVKGHLHQMEDISKGKEHIFYLDFDKELLKKSCLTQEQLKAYVQFDDFYAIHISKLEVFDKPRELSKFYKPLTRETCMCGCEKNCKICECRLTKAPKNYCYIESEE